MTDKIVVFCSCGSAEEAGRIAGRLVERRLAACVNILPGVTSVYRWKGELERAGEWLLLIKSSRARFEELASEIRRVHSYDLPEVIALPVVDGARDYLEWLEAETGTAG